MNIFKIKENAMDPQTHKHTGEVKLDADGRPLRSVQIIQDVDQRHDMVGILKNMPRIYKQNTGLFPKGKHQVGNDPKPTTVKSMMKDCADRIEHWNGPMSNAHIYRSFVDRHNWCLDRLIEGLYAKGRIDLIEGVENDYRIILRLPDDIRLARSLQKSDVFDTSWDDE